MADKNNNKNLQKGAELFNECLAAMMYSDEEILEAMSPDDAEEFIKLRNNLVAPEADYEIFVGKYAGDDNCSSSLAAEEEENYE